ncbi:MAG: prepilin peptidase [Clostridia bacterium]|nr:prepilin peptidase [Clostridia bacterium]
MNIFLYCIIFIMGILFGSFYTLAVYRIPRKEDITHTHSYCPNCNAKLGFFELIPVLSYIFLGGKCKHCGKKIRIRYLLLELLSGATFVLLAMGLKLDIYNLNIPNVVFLGFSFLYITFIFLIAGIDKEYRKIEKSVIYFGTIIVSTYMIYLYIVEHANIHRYVIYLFAMVILLYFDNTAFRKHSENSYTIGILLLIAIMAIFTGEIATIYTIAITLIASGIYIILRKIKLSRSSVKRPDNIRQELRLGFILCCSNIITLLSLVNM